jgi:seryl-tRNA synthetase
MEEIKKQLYFISETIEKIKPSNDFLSIEIIFKINPHKELLESLDLEIKKLFEAFKLSKKSIVFEKKFQNSRCEKPISTETLSDLSLIKSLGSGVYAYAGIFQRLINGLDKHLKNIALSLDADEFIFPNLVSTSTLIKSGYLKNFPHQSQPIYDPNCNIESLRSLRQEIKEGVRVSEIESFNQYYKASDFSLSPAVCYHCYEFFENSIFEKDKGKLTTAMQSCYRFEGKSTGGLERLREFKMREFIAMGEPEFVQYFQNKFINIASKLCEDFEINCQLKSASDPFFIDDYNAKRIFQTGFELKLELLTQFKKAPSLAISSINYHQDYFGNSFNLRLHNGKAAHSCCIGFGLDRWCSTIFSTHGVDPMKWPDELRKII